MSEESVLQVARTEPRHHIASMGSASDLTARQQLQNADLLELLQLSDDRIDGLEKTGHFDKSAELKRWQRAASELADSGGDQSLVCCGVQYALYIHLSDRALELAGTDLEPDGVAAVVVSVEPQRSFSIQAKLRVAPVFLDKGKESLLEDVSIDQSFLFCVTSRVKLFAMASAAPICPQQACPCPNFMPTSRARAPVTRCMSVPAWETAQTVIEQYNIMYTVRKAAAQPQPPRAKVHRD